MLQPAARRVRLVARHDLRRRLGQPAALRPDRPVRGRADGEASACAGWWRARCCWSRPGSGLTVFMHAELAAHPLLGRAGRPRHRLDGPGLRGDRHQPLVRRAPRPGHRRADRRRRGRAADLPAGAGPAHRRARLADRGPDRGVGGAARRAAGLAGGSGTSPPTSGATAYGGGARRRRLAPLRPPASAARTALRALTPGRPDAGRSGCWRAASRSAGRPRTAWSAPTSSRPRTTTA